MMIAGGDHFAVIQGFRNPTPEDRNLEPKLDERECLRRESKSYTERRL